jgi:hypothetical protein
MVSSRLTPYVFKQPFLRLLAEFGLLKTASGGMASFKERQIFTFDQFKPVCTTIAQR